MLLKDVSAGAAIGADAIGRYLSPAQRSLLVTQLTGDAETRAAAVLTDARSAAAAILAEAEAEADGVRTRAYAEGLAAGRTAGNAQGMAELERTAATLRRAAEAAQAVYVALLEGVEQQAVELALIAARRVVGAAAESHAGLAAEIVREGIRAAGNRILRVRVHPDDTEPVTAAVFSEGQELPVAGDTSIAAGGCVIDVEGGTVDLQLGTQLAGIERALRP
jgi:flagellar assembly protein FliH